MRRLLFRIVLLAIAASVLAPPVFADPIDDYVKAQLSQQHIPGLSLAVVKDGHTVKLCGYGLADFDTHTPTGPGTVYQLASVTKQFTASAIMILAQEHKLSIDDPISKYIANTPPNWRAITIRECMSNTSGVLDGLNELHGNTKNGTTPAEIVSVISKYPLKFPPNTDWSYSNTNFMLLGMVIQKVTGETYDHFLAERIFTPLKMSSTHRDTDTTPNRASGYDWTGTQWKASNQFNSSLWDNGEAGILSSAADLAKWAEELDTGNILTQDSRSQMWTPTKLANGSSFAYGFGWFTVNNGRQQVVSHSGGGPGVATAIVRYVKSRITVIVLANMTTANSMAIAHHIARLIDPVDTEPKLVHEVDHAPQANAAAEAFIHSIQTNSFTARQFTPELWKDVGPHGGDSLQSMIALLGKPLSFHLQSQIPSGKNTHYSYLVLFEDGACEFGCVFTPDYRFAGGDLNPM